MNGHNYNQDPTSGCTQKQKILTKTKAKCMPMSMEDRKISFAFSINLEELNFTAQAACSHILLGLTGKERMRGIVLQSSETQPTAIQIVIKMRNNRQIIILQYITQFTQR